jgi:hypothetical protein
MLERCLHSIRKLEPHQVRFQIFLGLLPKTNDNIYPEIPEKIQQLVGRSILRLPACLAGKARNELIKKIKEEREVGSAPIFDWVGFIDDDAYYPENYFTQWLELVKSYPQMECFGGSDAFPPDDECRILKDWNISLAQTLSSPFFGGPTFLRHFSSSRFAPFITNEWTLTSCHLWIKNDILSMLEFPEDYKRAEDCHALRTLQKKFCIRCWKSLGLFVYHSRRKKLSDILLLFWETGFYRAKLFQESCPGKCYYVFFVLFLLLGIVLLAIAWFTPQFILFWLGGILFWSLFFSVVPKRLALREYGCFFLQTVFLHISLLIAFVFGFLQSHPKLKKIPE